MEDEEIDGTPEGDKKGLPGLPGHEWIKRFSDVPRLDPEDAENFQKELDEEREVSELPASKWDEIPEHQP